MRPIIKLNVLAFTLGLVRIFLLPGELTNLGGAIFYSLCLILLYLYSSYSSRLAKIILSLSVPTAIYLAITTNPLVSNLNYFVIFLSLFWFLTISYQGTPFTSATSFLDNILAYPIDFLQQLFNLSNFKEYLSFDFSGKSFANPLKKAVIILPTLAIFHFLFTQINQDYSTFTWVVVEPIINFIRYIINIDIIWKILYATLVGYFYYILVATKRLFSVKSLPQPPPVVSSLFPTIILFVIFIFFQSRLLFQNFTQLPFKTLSLYVQTGFWELLAVSILGYLLSLACLAHVSSKNYLRPLLTIFAVELLVIVSFTYHKLFNLQFYFGFKDQRLLATVATSLILITFILHLIRLWGKLSATSIFSIQLVSLLISILCFNIINVDQWLSGTNPISYYANNQRIKDYSYLLGNSYDNYPSWLRLLSELQTQGLIFPETEYYWGKYHPICTKYTYLNRLHSDTYLSTRYEYLTNKYQNFPKKFNFVQFNYHEYRAYQLISRYSVEFSKTVELINNSCPLQK